MHWFCVARMYPDTSGPVRRTVRLYDLTLFGLHLGKDMVLSESWLRSPLPVLFQLLA